MARIDQDPADVLHGWKEIASHLGRSARSVQRWERDLGLPVHRIPTPDGGSIVYALRSEVDAWRAGQDELRPFSDTDLALAAVDPDAARDGAPERPGAAGWWRASIPAWAAITMATVAAALGVVAGTWPAAGGVPATWELEGQRMRTFADSGRELWTHDFERMVSRPSTFVRAGGTQSDLDGDGRPETLVPVRYASSSRDSTSESDAVLAFSADGRQLWSVQPQLTLQAGDESFEGPWYVYDIATGLTAAGPRAWIAFSHHTWWPGFLIEVDSAGNQKLRYVQGGRVYAVEYWDAGGGARLVAGGTARDPGLASAVFLDAEGPGVNWPADGSAHLTCDGCGADRPLAVMLFPTSHVTTALSRPYGWVFRIKHQADGVQLSINEGFGDGTLVTVAGDLSIAGLERSDRYWQVHRDLESQGRIAHAAEDCPDSREPIQVRRWTAGTGWSLDSVLLRVSHPTPAVE